MKNTGLTWSGQTAWEREWELFEEFVQLSKSDSPLATQGLVSLWWMGGQTWWLLFPGAAQDWLTVTASLYVSHGKYVTCKPGVSPPSSTQASHIAAKPSSNTLHLQHQHAARWQTVAQSVDLPFAIIAKNLSFNYDLRVHKVRSRAYVTWINRGEQNLFLNLV